VITANARVYYHVVDDQPRRLAYGLSDGSFYFAVDDPRVRGLVGREVAIRFHPEDQFAHLVCDHCVIERSQIHEHCVTCGAVRRTACNGYAADSWDLTGGLRGRAHA
jgi:hypothetical protein